MGIQKTNSETYALMKPLYFKDKEQLMKIQAEEASCPQRK